MVMPRHRRLRKRRLGRKLWVFAVVLGVSVISAGSFGWAERLFYYPSRAEFVTPDGAEDVWFTNADGLKLHGWFIPPEGNPEGPWPVVLHVHGNAHNLIDHVGFCDWLTEHGYAVMLFDYRQYGRSEHGPLDRDAVLRDANAALDAVLARDDIDPDRLVVFGFSLGGATSIRLMSQRDEPLALVAAAPFSGWQRVAGDYVPGISKLLIRSGGDPEEAIAQVGDRPVLLLHGTSDGIVKPYHTQRLLDAAMAAGVPAQRVTFNGLDHNSLLLDPQVRATIVAFLDRVVPARNAD